MPEPPDDTRDDGSGVGDRLLITADDYGYSPAYNRGILEAGGAGAIDAAGAMVLRRWCEPGPLLATGVDPGLHLERGETVGAQLERFERSFGRPPAYLDGHHHCHADPELEPDVIAAARRLEVRVRAIDEGQRRRLRAAGIATPDRLVGRLAPGEAPLPPEVARVEHGEAALPGLTEWMVHPGRLDPDSGSAYDAEREQDLDLVLRLAGAEPVRAWREGRPSGA